jgi:hypothetical protein
MSEISRDAHNYNELLNSLGAKDILRSIEKHEAAQAAIKEK